MMDVRVAFDCDGAVDTLEANRTITTTSCSISTSRPWTRAAAFVHAHTVQQALERLIEDEALRQAADAVPPDDRLRGFLNI
jgi:hypothetical protein